MTLKRLSALFASLMQMKIITRFFLPIAALGLTPIKLRFCFILGVYLFCDLIKNNIEQFSPYEVFLLSGYLGVILLLQQAILQLCYWRLRRSWPVYALASVFSMLNILTIVFLHGGKFLQADLFIQIVIIIAIGLVLFFVLWQGKAIIFGLTSVLLLAVTFYNMTFLIRAYYFFPNPLPKSFVTQDFVRTPNIYLLSIDALIPESLGNHFLKLDNVKSLYVEALNELGAQIIPNAFSDFNKTVSTLNSMLALDLDWWQNDLVWHNRSALTTGNQWNPAYEIFTRNGYKIQLVYRSDFFDFLKKKSNYVDYYFQHAKGFCQHAEDFVFWGFCDTPLAYSKEQVYALQDGENLHEVRLEAAAQSQSSYLTIAYIRHLIHHTPKSHNPYSKQDFMKYKKRFLEQTKLVAELIKRHVSIIRKNDPDGIIIFFGDHGAYFTRGLLANDVPDDSPYSKTEIIQDRHGILMAVLDGGSGCRIQQGVLTTTSDMMLNLIECLTGGKPVLKNRTSNEPRFIDYIYE